MANLPSEVKPVDINFSKVVINNAYPILSGGTWDAVLDPKTGKTVYQSGTVQYDGPVNMLHGVLTIHSGAVVDGLYKLANVPWWGGSSNPKIYIQSGGKLENSTIFNGYTYVQSGGISENNSYVSDDVDVQGGAVSDGDYFYNPGDTGAAGGTIVNPNLPNGSTTFRTSDSEGWIGISSGAEVNSPHIIDSSKYNPNSSNIRLNFNPGGSFNLPEGFQRQDYKNYVIQNDYPIISGGTWSAVLDPATGKTIYQSGAVKVDGPVDMIHGVLNVQSGAVVSGIYSLANMPGYGGASNPTINVLSGGQIKDSTIFNGYLNISNGGISEDNTYVSEVVNISSGGISNNDNFYNPGDTGDAGGKLINPNLGGAGSSSFRTSDTAVSVTAAKGGTIENPHVDNPSTGTVAVDVSGIDANYVPCFLAGTLIQTANGDIAVENLRVNDEVYIHTENGLESRRITALVVDQHFVNPELADDEAGYAICITKGAIAENMPFQDLFVTPDHCLFFDGKFIPARMLVNNRSVYYDYSKKQYTYYHIETEEHSVISANGMLTESFLNTENHIIYKNVIRLPKTWQNDAAATLTVDRAVVEPLFNTILDRALANNISKKSDDLLMTEDSGVLLITNNGQIVHRQMDTDKFVFVLPKNTSSVRIISRSSRPCDVIGPFVDDRRSLGLLIQKITLFNKNKSFEIDTHLTTKDLAGWYNLDHETLRWTNGDAVLPLENYCQDDTSILVLEIASAGPYLLQENEEYQQAV